MPYADPERKKVSDRAYGMAHREERAARCAAWRLAHPNARRERYVAHRQEELDRRMRYSSTTAGILAAERGYQKRMRG